jgi:hypothetical protein
MIKTGKDNAFRRDTKAYGRKEVRMHLFLLSTPDVNGQPLSAEASPSGKGDPVTPWIGGWPYHRADFDLVSGYEPVIHTFTIYLMTSSVTSI